MLVKSYFDQSLKTRVEKDLKEICWPSNTADISQFRHSAQCFPPSFLVLLQEVQRVESCESIGKNLLLPINDAVYVWALISLH